MALFPGKCIRRVFDERIWPQKIHSSVFICAILDTMNL